MKIAFVSYEYPPDTAFGGIATYVYQAARMLRSRGHHVEVFCGSDKRNVSHLDEAVLVHRVRVTSREEFTSTIASAFAERYSQVKFDVIESPEIGAEAKEIIDSLPGIALVVRLHTPSFICRELGYIKPSVDMKIRRFLGALRRFKRPEPFSEYTYEVDNDYERLLTLEADEISAPSISIGNKLLKVWDLPIEKLCNLANPYIPSRHLLKIPIETQTDTVSFIGRLERRKGIIDLMNAIPLILNHHPHTKFRFIGSGSAPSPEFGLDMQAYVAKKLKKFQSSLEFMGRVELESIPNWLSKTDICVFPSIWENFPYTCLEAMAAGRGVVGSSAGGMAEMLDNGKAGLLIPPQDPMAIAIAVCKLLKDPTLRMKLGQEARNRVLSEYNVERIGSLQEASYERAIKRRKELGDR